VTTDGKGTIAIVGAGFMGAAIATLCAAHGYRVALNDTNEKMLLGFRERAMAIARQLAGPSRTADEILNLVTPEPSLERSISGAFLVHEIIHEDLEAKRALFRRLVALCGADVMLATNTSSFLISEICGDIEGRERIIGIHYVSPPHLIRAVEIITASFTDPALVPRARAFVESIDHVGIVCRERPGFLINKIQYALKAEVQRIVEEGVASVEDIDAAVRLSIGPRLALWGPMMQEDLSTTKKTVLSVTDYIHKATGEAHYASLPVLRRLVESGQNGAISGAGWYEWGGDYAQLVGERDRQLADLLDWLRKNERLDALGAKGENERLRDRS
jgi:3-hydroxybutyryl-CoA dehydrogenase